MIKLIRSLFSKPEQYYCFVFLANHDSPKIWINQHWERFSTEFGSVLDAIEGKPHIRITQYRIDDSGKQEREAINYGRLYWTNESFRTWLLPEHCVDRVHYSTEISAPSISVCEKQNILPSVFIHSLDLNANMDDEWKIGYRLLVCVEESVFNKCSFQSNIDRLAEFIGPTHLFFKIRPWGYFWGSSDKDTAGIEDYTVIMPMYNERVGEPIGEPKHGWVDKLKQMEA